MKGTEKQIEFATKLMQKMNKEFTACKEIAPTNVHQMFDKIEDILNESYAGDVIDLLINNKNEGQKYFTALRSSIAVSANPAAMKIKREMK